MNVNQVEPVDRDLLAEAREAAHDWVRWTAACVSSNNRIALESWERRNLQPKRVCREEYAEWQSRRDNLLRTVDHACRYAVWGVLARAGYEPEVLGAPELPDFEPPAHLRYLYATTAHHIRYCTSRRLSGMQQVVKHRRNLYLGIGLNEQTVRKNVDKRTVDGGRVKANAIITRMDPATAAAEELFHRALIDGLRQGLIDFGFLDNAAKE